MTRLQTYRAFLAAMNPSADPSLALAQGRYVEPPGGGIWAALTGSLELDPTSTHLVLGGIGSGKTSELLWARRRLMETFEETGDLALYCDVSQRHNLGAAPKPGVLFALASQLLISPDLRAIQSLAPNIQLLDALPDHATSWEADVDALTALLAHRLGVGRAAVVLFDSLDRLPDSDDFTTIVEGDIKALKAAGVGVVVVGPVRFMVGNDRALTDLFDRTHFQLATNPQTDQGMAFLCDVLRRRDAECNLLSEECLPALAEASGGNLRDLIALAKRSAEEAYAGGHPSITLEDVIKAANAFGRTLALGLDTYQIRTLKDLANFVVRGEPELSLLETRRVLMYDDARWAVHPTLAPLLAGIPAPEFGGW